MTVSKICDIIREIMVCILKSFRKEIATLLLKGMLRVMLCNNNTSIFLRIANTKPFKMRSKHILLKTYNQYYTINEEKISKNNFLFLILIFYICIF